MVISNVRDYYKAVQSVCVPYYIREGIRRKEMWIAYYIWEMRMAENEAIREYQQSGSREDYEAAKAAMHQRKVYESILDWIDYAWGWSDMS